MREDGELPHRHLAEVQLDVDLLQRLIDWDQIVSEQPELIEENSGIVGHRLKVGVQVCLDLRGMQRSMFNMSAFKTLNHSCQENMTRMSVTVLAEGFKMILLMWSMPWK